MKKIYLTGLFIALALGACNNLDKEPEGVLSTTNPFTGIGEIQSYIDLFYQSGLRTQGFRVGGAQGIAGLDIRSDNMSANSPDSRLAGTSALSDATKLSNYTNIRNVNFFILNKENSLDKGATYQQLVGEAYYFRAWYYYELLVNYGPVTWLEKTLDPVQEQMVLPRDSRTYVTDKIIADLDTAASYLSTQNSNATMRIHRDVALALKSEVALFEGTWEKYHKAKNDKFYDQTITESKITQYLQTAASAAKEIIDRGVWSIYKGSGPLTSYRDIFKTADLTSNPEIFWYKRYDGSNVGNSVTRYLNKGGGAAGVTRSLVDDYLTIDGRPFVGAERDEAKKTYGDELLPTVRDPRLSQTICLPGQDLRPNGGYVFTVPPLNADSYFQNTTGYSLLKHVEFDIADPSAVDTDGKGSTPAIQFRYADILLNYAEALAELDGQANATLIIEAIHPLRDRVGLPDVDFDREYNTESDYPFRNLDKYIQAVRRERRIEKACEGRRFDDILRWAAADVLIVNQQPQGALYIGSNLESSYSNLTYDKDSGNNLFLTGKPGDANRYVLPINPAVLPNGYQFKLDRDYLLPIQPRMLSLTENAWEQNPGW